MSQGKKQCEITVRESVFVDGCARMLITVDSYSVSVPDNIVDFKINDERGAIPLSNVLAIVPKTQAI